MLWLRSIAMQECWKDTYSGDSSHPNGLYRLTAKWPLALCIVPFISMSLPLESINWYGIHPPLPLLMQISLLIGYGSSMLCLHSIAKKECWKDIYLGDSSHQNGLYRFTSKLLLAFLHHTVQKYHFALRTKWAVHTKYIIENPVSIVVSSSWKFTPSWECSILSTPIFPDISKWLESVVWV